MNTYYVCSMECSDRGRNQGPLKAISGLGPEDPSDEALPGRANKNWSSKYSKFI